MGSSTGNKNKSYSNVGEDGKVESYSTTEPLSCSISRVINIHINADTKVTNNASKMITSQVSTHLPDTVNVGSSVPAVLDLDEEASHISTCLTDHSSGVIIKAEEFSAEIPATLATVNT